MSISSKSFTNKELNNKKKDLVGQLLEDLQPCWIIDVK